MGINSSFITNYCTQLKFELTQHNLLSVGFERVAINQHENNTSSQEHIQLYQHYQSKKIYSFKQFQCSYQEGIVLSKALQSLQIIKNNHLCNVLFSSINNNSFTIISRIASINIFTENSSLNLAQFIQQKNKEKQLFSHYNHLQSVTPYTNIAIAHFVKNCVGILSEIQNLRLPIQIIYPQKFLVILNQAGKIKYDIDFQQFLTKNNKTTQNGYFSPQIWQNSIKNTSFLQTNQIQWSQKCQKNLVFAFGMLFMHYLLLQPLYDCYNYKSKEFCKSQLQNKITTLSKILQARHQENQRKRQKIKQDSSTQMTEVYMERFNTESIFDDQEPFELILYEMILQMLAQDKSERIGIYGLKIQCKKMMQKIAQEYTMTKTEKTFTSNIQKAHQIAPRIKSTSNQSHRESFDDNILKKTFSGNQLNTIDSFLQRSQSRSIITHLRSKNVSDREKLINQGQQQNSILCTNRKSTNADKQNILNNKQLDKSDLKSLKGSIRKLCGYKKMKISQNSYIEGFFQNDKAHGLGKITRRNGQTMQCIFHNNEIIESISTSPRH